MSFTNLMLGHNWGSGEWPEYVLVSHEGAVDDVRYVPERTCHDLGGEIAGKVCELEGIGEGELCSPIVDIDALLALAEEMETADPEDLDVAIDYVTECASRIRDALGVSDD